MFEQLHYTLKARIWTYNGRATWYFVTVPKAESDEIKFFSPNLRGWKSVPVQVTIGNSQWKTSVFPSSESQSYILPIKASVRKKEGIGEGDEVTFQLRIAA